MKTFVLLISSLMMVLSANSQTKLGSITDAKTGGVLEIEFSADSTGFFELIFSDGPGIDPSIRRKFSVPDKIYKDFISGFVTARLKYVSWTKAATENEVKNFEKQISSNRIKAIGYCSSSTFGFTDYLFQIGLYFEVVNGSTFLNVESTRINQAPANSLSCEPISFSLSSLSEIEYFLSLISPARVNTLVDQYLRDSKKIQ